MQDINTKIEMFSKPYWSLKDISEFAECGKNKASQIRMDAIKHHKGIIRALPSKVRRDAVLEALGTTFEIEMKNLQRLRGLGNE